MSTRSTLRHALRAGIALTTVAFAVALPASADATASDFTYVGTSGATQVTAVGLTVQSDPTAESVLYGASPAHDSAKIASANVAGLLAVGAGTTDETATAVGNGINLVSHAKTAHISLLGGAIQADAIETTATAESDSSQAPSGGVTTQLLGLTIGGKKYPVDVKPNTGVTIPGVASIALNSQIIGKDNDSVTVMGAGLVITLLQQRGRAAAGAEIVVNPVYAQVQPSGPSNGGASLGGEAYGTYVFAHVGDQVQVESGRSAAVMMPLKGTNGQTYTNSTAAVRVPGAVVVGADESEMKGTTSPSGSDSFMANNIARVNLFNGLITAQALGTETDAQLIGGKETLTGSMQFVNLRIAGHLIPINVAPNTSIHLANLGTVTLNEQKTYSNPGIMRGVQVIGLHIILDTARAGLPVGADIQVGVSQSIVYG